MKRRGFIRLLGAAATAPALPIAAPAGVSTNASVLAAALARSNRYVSATGLSKALGVPLDQGREMLISLSRSGVVGPVSSSPFGSYANSNAYQGVIQTAQAIRPKSVVQKTKIEMRQAHKGTWLTHLHDLCRDAGMIVHSQAVKL